MPKPLLATGLTIEAQTFGPPAGAWASVGNVTSISGSEFSVPFTEITGKSDTIVQRYPGVMSPGTVSFRMWMWAQDPADWRAWVQALQHKAKYNIRVNCGDANPTAHVISFTGCYVSNVTIPQPEGDVFSYTVTFQLTS